MNGTNHVEAGNDPANLFWWQRLRLYRKLKMIGANLCAYFTEKGSSARQIAQCRLHQHSGNETKKSNRSLSCTDGKRWSTLSTKQCSIHSNSWLISKRRCFWLRTGISDEVPVISMRQNADGNRGVIDCGTGPNRVAGRNGCTEGCKG